ncbi:small acid-soluble spore protein Tlp [Ectobacillus ponti]|uniref:Small, acid-soluble spore protein Tlp n=1 Tax=Ectobacillus ponti TaxID=2961894 RepID=A0AA41X576_9BACI|nr:small acid-soluble spore protein Tlp [Ectobacillus ponti]MCP8969134.1 small acid-soluble spore protein Tlp [Ectobacillus ponti]
MTKNFTPNPDDRSDNVEKLQEMVQNTIHNIHAAEDAMANSTAQDCAAIEAKNQRRMDSIEAMRSEIKEEYAYRKEH